MRDLRGCSCFFCIGFDHAQPAEDTAIPRGEEARRDGRDAAQACPLCSVDRRRGGIFHFSWNHGVACPKRKRASRRKKIPDCIRYFRTVRKHVSGNFSREELWPSGEKLRQCLSCRCELFGLRIEQSAEIKKPPKFGSVVFCVLSLRVGCRLRREVLHIFLHGGKQVG